MRQCPSNAYLESHCLAGVGLPSSQPWGWNWLKIDVKMGKGCRKYFEMLGLVIVYKMVGQGGGCLSLTNQHPNPSGLCFSD